MNLEIYAPVKRLKIEKPDTLRKLEKVESFLKLAPRTSHDVSMILGISSTGGALYLNTLYYERRAHISGWEGYGRNCLPIFSIGDGVDVPRPRGSTYKKPREDSRERDMRRRMLNLSQEEQDLISLKNWVPHRDPLVAAFFGEHHANQTQPRP